MQENLDEYELYIEELKALMTPKLRRFGFDDVEDSTKDDFAREAYELLLFHLNEDELPSEALHLLCEIAVGMCLKSRLLAQGDTNGTAVSVREGLVSVSYKNGSSIWEIADEMCKITDYKISRFRRIQW